MGVAGVSARLSSRRLARTRLEDRFLDSRAHPARAPGESKKMCEARNRSGVTPHLICGDDDLPRVTRERIGCSERSWPFASFDASPLEDPFGAGGEGLGVNERRGGRVGVARTTHTECVSYGQHGSPITEASRSTLGVAGFGRRSRRAMRRVAQARIARASRAWALGESRLGWSLPLWLAWIRALTRGVLVGPTTTTARSEDRACCARSSSTSWLIASWGRGRSSSLGRSSDRSAHHRECRPLGRTVPWEGRSR